MLVRGESGESSRTHSVNRDTSPCCGGILSMSDSYVKLRRGTSHASKPTAFHRGSTKDRGSTQLYEHPHATSRHVKIIAAGRSTASPMVRLGHPTAHHAAVEASISVSLRASIGVLGRQPCPPVIERASERSPHPSFCACGPPKFGRRNLDDAVQSNTQHPLTPSV